MSPRKNNSLQERFTFYLKRLRYLREERAKRRYKKKVMRRHLKERKKEEKQKPQRVRSRTKKPIRRVFPPLPAIPIFERQNRKFLYLAINSTAIYVCTFILIYLLYQIIIVAGATFWGTNTIEQYFRLVFTGQPSLFTRLGILFIATMGPLLVFIVGVLLFGWVLRKKHFAGLQRLFILWLALHAFNHFLGAWMYGAITREGFKDVSRVVHISQVLMYLLAFITLVALIWTGFRAARPFLETTTSLTLINSENRRKFMVNQAIMPWIIGSILLAVFFAPDNMNFTYEMLTFITMGFMVVGAWLNRHRRPRLRIRKVKTRIKYTYIVLMVILLLSFWVAQNKGIGFMSVFDLIK
jgi:hypothetical protein